MPFVLFLENTRKVSRNLGCRKKSNHDEPSNLVDVLIPEVIQVPSYKLPMRAE